MNRQVSMLQLMLVLFTVFVFITLTDISLLFGAVLLPFAAFFLVRLKHQSNYHFWLTFISFLIPAILLLSPDSWLWFVVLYIVATVLHRTLKNEDSQELTLFYLTAALMISTIGGLNLLQGLGYIQPLSETYLNIRNWYIEQVEMYGSIASSTLDSGLIQSTMDQLFINLPAHITVLSFLIALYTVLMQRVLFASTDVKLWKYRSFKEWIFPRFVLHLFLILFIVSFFTTEGAAQSTIGNIMVVMEWALFLHGLSFLYFFFMEKKLNKALSIALLVPFALLRPITLLIGIFEMIFRFRKLLLTKRK
ncbi:hypothetical protein GCM10022378_09570 [Salinicoccus jeotgali]|uniref:DUF2232 domain-containing protein n=1 Tax=Salinicoccus jeotgali TaxID=381634 RepID=A0ABP7EN51_9STAP